MPTKNASESDFKIYLLGDNGEFVELGNASEINFFGTEEKGEINLSKTEEVHFTGHINWWNRLKMRRQLRKLFGRKTVREARKQGQRRKRHEQKQTDRRDFT